MAMVSKVNNHQQNKSKLSKVVVVYNLYIYKLFTGPNLFVCLSIFWGMRFSKQLSPPRRDKIHLYLLKARRCAQPSILTLSSTGEPRWGVSCRGYIITRETSTFNFPSN